MKTFAAWMPALAFVLVCLAGCLALDQPGYPGEYGNSDTDLVGEISNIDSRASEIEIRTDAGATRSIQYDRQTKVLYRQREYAVSNLEPGDYVAVRVQQDRDGTLYADTVTVKESVQERGGANRQGSGRLDRIEGTVERIDGRRGQFQIRDRSNRLVVVSLQYDAPREVSDRFNRLREGDTVRVEGRFLNSERFELEDFL